MEKLNIYSKLQKARVELQKCDIKKSGKNSYSHYTYFELGDFLAYINEICYKNGLNTLFHFDRELAKLTIVNVDNPEEFEVFTTPIDFATIKGGTTMQNIGATQTYARRYLYMMAFEIAENDLIDSGAIDHEKEIAKTKIDNNKVVVIKRIIDDTETDVHKFLQYFNVKKVEDITEGQFINVIRMLEKKKEEKKNNQVEESVW